LRSGMGERRRRWLLGVGWDGIEEGFGASFGFKNFFYLYIYIYYY
jgi:hypothetical protein